MLVTVGLGDSALRHASSSGAAAPSGNNSNSGSGNAYSASLAMLHDLQTRTNEFLNGAVARQAAAAAGPNAATLRRQRDADGGSDSDSANSEG